MVSGRRFGCDDFPMAWKYYLVQLSLFTLLTDIEFPCLLSLFSFIQTFDFLPMLDDSCLWPLPAAGIPSAVSCIWEVCVGAQRGLRAGPAFRLIRKSGEAQDKLLRGEWSAVLEAQVSSAAVSPGDPALSLSQAPKPTGLTWQRTSH